LLRLATNPREAGQRFVAADDGEERSALATWNAFAASQLGSGVRRQRAWEHDTFQSRRSADDMGLKRMDNVGIVVESLDAVIPFFIELGMRLEGRATIEGEWAGRVTGLGRQHVDIAMLVTPDGHNRLELSRFLTPVVVADHRTAPVNALGYLRAMFTVDDIDDTLARLRPHGAELVRDVVQYQDIYRLCYIRGPEGLLIGLAEELKRNEHA
jgi:catechol 2,3-dioxygenase-like lactoylglutathione lyase family enzyme